MHAPSAHSRRACCPHKLPCACTHFHTHIHTCTHTLSAHTPNAHHVQRAHTRLAHAPTCTVTQRHTHTLHVCTPTYPRPTHKHTHKTCTPSTHPYPRALRAHTRYSHTGISTPVHTRGPRRAQPGPRPLTSTWCAGSGTRSSPARPSSSGPWPGQRARPRPGTSGGGSASPARRSAGG